ncbi:MAG: hypothetical protein J1F03_10195 [Oscillospiraceae bacterium]|nr:hypothetical protein [Oscillospiraceae bacterium]
MVLFIALKDIAAFFRSEKKVFIWLMICMISASFVLNYSYSFARYSGTLYEESLGAARTRYTINTGASTTAANGILNRISEGDFPEIDNYQFFRAMDGGYSVVGSSRIGRDRLGDITGLWHEGYHAEIENTGGNIIAINQDLLDYGDRLKMTGETVVFDGEEFTVMGVFESFFMDTGAVIFADKFAEKYSEFDSFRLAFEDRLSEEQQRKLTEIIRENIPNASITYPPAPGEAGSDFVKTYELMYSAIIIMLVVCLTSLIKYWQTVNLPTYTVYWLNGATKGTVMRAALCESLLLCVSAYLVGLVLNALLRELLTHTAPLTLADIGIGFGIFFGTFAVFTLINTAKICKQLKITNLRRD